MCLQNIFIFIIFFIGSTDAFTEWPNDLFFMLKPIGGCPSKDQTSDEYFEYFDKTEPNLKTSKSISIEILSDDDYFEHEVVVCGPENEDEAGHTTEWPKGTYCLNNQDGSSCPQNFKKSNVKLTKNLFFETDNELQTAYFFCCRTDGNIKDAIELPNIRPFILIPTIKTCQKVKGMNNRIEWIEIPRNSSKIQKDSRIPYFGNDNVKGVWIYYFCFYQPINSIKNNEETSKDTEEEEEYYKYDQDIEDDTTNQDEEDFDERNKSEDNDVEGDDQDPSYEAEGEDIQVKTQNGLKTSSKANPDQLKDENPKNIDISIEIPDHITTNSKMFQAPQDLADIPEVKTDTINLSDVNIDTNLKTLQEGEIEIPRLQNEDRKEQNLDEALVKIPKVESVTPTVQGNELSTDSNQESYSESDSNPSADMNPQDVPKVQEESKSEFNSNPDPNKISESSRIDKNSQPDIPTTISDMQEPYEFSEPPFVKVQPELEDIQKITSQSDSYTNKIEQTRKESPKKNKITEHENINEKSLPDSKKESASHAEHNASLQNTTGIAIGISLVIIFLISSFTVTLIFFLLHKKKTATH